MISRICIQLSGAAVVRGPADGHSVALLLAVRAYLWFFMIRAFAHGYSACSVVLYVLAGLLVGASRAVRLPMVQG